MKALHSLWLIGPLAAALLLSGCGGGGGGGGTTSTPPSGGTPPSDGGIPLSGGGSYKEVTLSGGQGSDSVSGFGTSTKYVLLTRYTTADTTDTPTGYTLAKSFSQGKIEILAEPWTLLQSSPAKQKRRDEYTLKKDMCTQMREWEKTHLVNIGPAILPSRSHTLPENVGDRHAFWVSDAQGGLFLRDCTNRRIGTYCYVYADDVDWSSGLITDFTMDSVVAEFDRIYPLVRAAFGSEWTTNGGRDRQPGVYIVISSKVTPYAYFHPRDEFSSADQPLSNEKEVLYVAPSPFFLGDLDAWAALAHEFQHMVSFNEKFGKQGQFNGVTGGEDIWLNEGLSKLAEVIIGYGLPKGSKDGYGRVKQFEDAPNNYSLTKWTPDNYGISYLFVQYLHDWYGGNAITAMESNSLHGTDNVAAVTGKSFDQVFQEWCMAMFLDTAGVTTDYMYFKSIDTSGTFGGKYFGSLPGPLIDSVDGAAALSSNQSSRSMKGNTLELIRVFLNAGSGNLTMTLTDSNGKNLKATRILGY